MLMNIISETGFLPSTLLIVLVAIFCFGFIFVIPVCVANIADKQGRNALGWFFLSFLMNPFFALIVLIALGDTKAKRLEKVMEEEQLRCQIRASMQNGIPNNNIDHGAENSNSRRKESDHSRFMPH